MLGATFSTNRNYPLHLVQWLGGVTEGFLVDVHFVHHAKEKAGHLAVGLPEVVQILPAFDPAASAAEHHDRQLVGVMIAGDHAGAEHQHRVVERGALALLDAVQAAGDVGHLLEEKLVHFQPVVRVVV